MTVNHPAPDAEGRRSTAALFLPEPERHDGEVARWHVEIDLDRHDEVRGHLVNGQPTVPTATLVQLAAEAAVSFAPDLAPLRYTDLRLPRLLRAPAERWPRRVEVTAARLGDEVRVRIGGPSANGVPAVGHARTTVHLGVPEWPEPEADHPPIDHRFSGYLLPGDALDSLLRKAAEPESLAGVEAIDIPLPADDRELARLLGPYLDLRRYSTEDGERYTATAADGTVVVRLRGVRSATPDLATLRRHRTGARTPGRAGRRTRSVGRERDGG